MLRNRLPYMGLGAVRAIHSVLELASSASELANSAAEWAGAVAGKLCFKVGHALLATEWIHPVMERVHRAFRKPSPEADSSRSALEVACSATALAASAAARTGSISPQAWARPPPTSAEPCVVNHNPRHAAGEKPST